jgi:hypothetical protein
LVFIQDLADSSTGVLLSWVAYEPLGETVKLISTSERLGQKLFTKGVADIVKGVILLGHANNGHFGGRGVVEKPHYAGFGGDLFVEG